MKLLAKHMMESVSGVGNQDNIDNIKFINDQVLTAAIGASMTPAAPVAGAGTAVVGSLIHSTNHQIQARKIRACISQQIKTNYADGCGFWFSGAASASGLRSMSCSERPSVSVSAAGLILTGQPNS